MYGRLQVVDGALREIADSFPVVAVLLVDRSDEISQDGPFVERCFGGIVAVHEILQGFGGFSLFIEHVGEQIESGDIVFAEFFVEQTLVDFFQSEVFVLTDGVSGIGSHPVVEGVVDVIVTRQEIVGQLCRIDLGEIFPGFDIHARKDIAIRNIEDGIELHAWAFDPVCHVEFHAGVEGCRIEIVLIVFVVEIVVNPVALQVGGSRG